MIKYKDVNIINIFKIFINLLLPILYNKFAPRKYANNEINTYTILSLLKSI